MLQHAGTHVSRNWCGWFLVTSSFFCRIVLSDDPVAIQTSGPGVTQADPAKLEYFETTVRPLLAKRCYECHSTEKGPDNGSLILDTAEGIAVGGSRGLIISREDTARSLLLHTVRYADADLQMPPEGKLPDAEIAVLERWINDGAVLPEYKIAPRPTMHEIDYEAARQFWSFQPLKSSSVPAVERNTWVRRLLDAFILARLNEHKLAPNPEADRATLLRRLTFDVIGLPPSPEELDAFVNDQSPDAVEKTVERLLASPHFGERWARVWLDLARYTDSTPDWQSPTDRGWMYRDWVVQAFNQNMPYDQFLRLQLAADLIPETPPADLAALGFIGLSPTYWKELALAPSVIEQIVADEWDERIDAVSRTFLGLTVSCARCHDHKFDAISTQDYYGLAGVFASSQLDERPLLPASEVAAVKAVRHQIKDLEAKLKPLKEQKSPEAEAVEKQIADLKATNPNVELPWAHVLREASLYVQPDGADRTRLEYREGEFRDLPVFRRGNPSNPGEVVPRRFLKVFQPAEESRFTQGSGRAELAAAILTKSQGLVARVIVNRIWDQHFNAGLVRTPSDFGAQGDRPTHPELLEYLAAEFVSHGWDLKWLHREILLSATYRQSAAFRDDGNLVDPANNLLWRSNRRRLDIEMWRDATLAVCGKLDLKMGGPSQPIDDLNNVRRTIYVKVEREELHPMLRMHDFPEASSHSPRRDPTTTPLQQLFVLNSPWMEQQASALYERLKPIENHEERLRTCYRLLFAREPNAAELELSTQYLQVGNAASEAEQASRWNDYLQALLGLNEFHFVD
ncbi:MAG: PSD1 and planctomycete cytochrome C domain-containing protein [Planctomycetaceae bacterium]